MSGSPEFHGAERVSTVTVEVLALSRSSILGKNHFSKAPVGLELGLAYPG
jgi:hypothetical protein